MDNPRVGGKDSENSKEEDKKFAQKGKREMQGGCRRRVNGVRVRRVLHGTGLWAG